MLPNFVGGVNDNNADFIGITQLEHFSPFDLRFPVTKTVVSNWSVMEDIWHYLFDSKLCLRSDQQPVLITETHLNSRSDREKTVEVLFENFAVPAMSLQNQATLSLYASGRFTGCVLQSGEGGTFSVPIYEGYIEHHGIKSLGFGGKTLTDYMIHILLSRQHFFRAAHRRNAFPIKETMAYFAEDYYYDTAIEKSYVLPDGHEITLGQERLDCPELFFNPFVYNNSGALCNGVHNCVHDSIQLCDDSLRRDFYSSIVLSGGCTMIPGFSNRLNKELRTLVPSTIRVNVIAPPERKYSAWIGGSILASLSTFQQMWITKAIYDEHGPEIVHKKCQT